MDHKFRLWNDRDKCWELGYELPNLGGFSMIGEVMIFGEYTNVLSKFKLEELDLIKIMQFTGIIDINGKEIYESDIIRYTQHLFNTDLKPTKTKEIKWNKWTAAWNIFETNAGETNIEVIGNIYENPELLDGLHN